MCHFDIWQNWIVSKYSLKEVYGVRQMTYGDRWLFDKHPFLHKEQMDHCHIIQGRGQESLELSLAAAGIYMICLTCTSCESDRDEMLEYLKRERVVGVIGLLSFALHNSEFQLLISVSSFHISMQLQGESRDLGLYHQTALSCVDDFFFFFCNCCRQESLIMCHVTFS